MKKIIAPALLFLLFSNCTLIKYGRYYAEQDPGFPSTSNLFFYKGGKFESYFLSEGSKQLMETGKWKINKDSIIVNIDSTFSYTGKGNRYNERMSFKIKSKGILVIKKNVTGQNYTAVWIHSPDAE